MPWPQILLLIAAIYLLVKLIQGVRDFITWYREGRAFAAEQKRVKALRREQRSAGVNMPALKERPMDSSKPPSRLPETAARQPRDYRPRLEGDPETAEVNGSRRSTHSCCDSFHSTTPYVSFPSFPDILSVGLGRSGFCHAVQEFAGANE